MNVKKIVLTAFTLVFGELFMVACTHDSSSEWHAKRIEVEGFNSISAYDVLMRSMADSSSFDWRLISAIAYAESGYRADARSHRGAIGLMQIMPHTALEFGYEEAQLKDPRISIEIAIKLLHKIEDKFRFPETMPERDRIMVILAAYNAGHSFILRVRKQAAKEGAAYNNFEVLSDYITREGTHSETVQFANKVYDKYLTYLSMERQTNDLHRENS